MNSTFDDLLEKTKSILRTKTNEFGIVKSAFVTSEEDFKLLTLYFGYAKGSCGHSVQNEFDKCYYRGTPDWYFLEGEPADRDGPSTWHFETLTEKKEKFQKFVEEYI